MDLAKYYRDPRYRLGLSLILGAILGLFLRHPGQEHHSVTWSDEIARLDHLGFPPRMLIAIALTFIPAIYWEMAARNATKIKEPFRTRIVHLALTSIGQLLIFLPVPGLRARFMPLFLPVVAMGLIIEATAVSLSVWARRILGKNWSGAIATNVDHQLIRTGPYRSIRHPIYTGILGMYLGATLVSGEMHALIGFALICIAYARKIRMEEAHLHEAFGPAYAEYARSSWRLVPKIL
jgi:protein-S-isoprenylcysteine O-methyltransferase Ste14